MPIGVRHGKSAQPSSRFGDSDTASGRRNARGATLTVEGDRQDYGEDRVITIGSLDAAMVVLVWTPPDGAYRIISIRKANERERTVCGPRF